MNHDMNVTQMQWQPEMIRLTFVGHPELDGGAQGPIYVKADAINFIQRAQVQFKKMDGSGQMLPGIICTEVHCCHYILYVTESPPQVAALRDAAFGHTPAKAKSESNTPLRPV